MAAKNTTVKRILKEAAEITTNPTPDFHAAPLEENLFEWHFTIRGPPSPSPFANGIYHGRIILPPAYPLRPPSFRFLTPSGRFEPNREICLSISGHHEETWQPAWGIRTALVAIRSFMDTDAAGQVGGMTSPDNVRKLLAEKSREYSCAACGRSGLAILEEQEEASKELGHRETSEVENALVGKIAFVEPKKEGTPAETPAPPSDASQPVESVPSAPSPPAVAAAAATEHVRPTSTTQRAPSPQTQSQPQVQAQTPPRVQLHQQPLATAATTTTDAWIDKAIIGIVIALVLIILRRVA